MSLTGTLGTWHDDRGFGFIAPTGGGRELFVHISAFPRDGSLPTVGESLTYELGRGKDGKPQAMRVVRQAFGQPAAYPRTRPGASRSRRRSPLGAVIGLVCVMALGAYGYSQYQRKVQRLQVTAHRRLPRKPGRLLRRCLRPASTAATGARSVRR